VPFSQNSVINCCETNKKKHISRLLNLGDKKPVSSVANSEFSFDCLRIETILNLSFFFAFAFASFLTS